MRIQRAKDLLTQNTNTTNTNDSKKREKDGRLSFQESKKMSKNSSTSGGSSLYSTEIV